MLRIPGPGGTAGVGRSGSTFPYVAGCQLQLDGAAVAGSLTHGGVDFDTTGGMHFAGTPMGIATTAVTDIVPAGGHTFSLACNQRDPDAVVVDAKISALMVSGG